MRRWWQTLGKLGHKQGHLKPPEAARAEGRSSQSLWRDRDQPASRFQTSGLQYYNRNISVVSSPPDYGHLLLQHQDTNTPSTLLMYSLNTFKIPSNAPPKTVQYCGTAERILNPAWGACFPRPWTSLASRSSGRNKLLCREERPAV